LQRRDLAEEAVQEGFALIWRNAGQFDRRTRSARGWPTPSCATGRSTWRVMARGERPIPPEDLDRMRDRAVGASWDGLDPDGMLHHRLKALEPSRRHALLLIYVLGLTHSEVAGRMNVPLGTAKAWIRRALVALRECTT
jgi:RNA polymerase sigma-70 factor, ECF subfamily